MELAAGGDLQLLEHLGQVVVDSPGANEQAGADLRVGKPLGGQPGNAGLLRRVHVPRSWTEKAYHNLVYFNETEKGGHFAAWEQPQLFSEELRAAFCTLR
jgi:pimeloyl-ACP methyl ester carboxylesterase